MVAHCDDPVVILPAGRVEYYARPRGKLLSEIG